MFSGNLHAERKYVLGTSVDFVGGVGNQVGQSAFNMSRLEDGIVPFYTVYPSIDFESTGRRSLIGIHYAFSADRYEMTPSFTTTSHAVTASLSTQLGRTARFRISNTFNSMPDFSTINVLKGFNITPEGFQYVFEPQLYKRSNISNSGNAALDVDLGPRSFLTFGVSGSYRRYDDSVDRNYFNDQMRIEGNLAFSHRTGKRQVWSFGYRVWQNDYEDRYDVRSHAGTIGLSRELNPETSLKLEAGPSFTEKSDVADSYLSYIIDAQLARRLGKNLFTAAYTHRSGDSTGLGGSSESHQGSLGFKRNIGRSASISFQASGFRQSQEESDLDDYWGVRSSLALSRQLGEYWVVSVGGSYMTYLGKSESYYDYTYKRVYASIGFRLPELWRGEK